MLRTNLISVRTKLFEVHTWWELFKARVNYCVNKNCKYSCGFFLKVSYQVVETRIRQITCDELKRWKTVRIYLNYTHDGNISRLELIIASKRIANTQVFTIFVDDCFFHAQARFFLNSFLIKTRPQLFNYYAGSSLYY